MRSEPAQRAFVFHVKRHALVGTSMSMFHVKQPARSGACLSWQCRGGKAELHRAAEVTFPRRPLADAAGTDR